MFTREAGGIAENGTMELLAEDSLTAEEQTFANLSTVIQNSVYALTQQSSKGCIYSSSN